MIKNIINYILTKIKYFVEMIKLKTKIKRDIREIRKEYKKYKIEIEND